MPISIVATNPKASNLTDPSHSRRLTTEASRPERRDLDLRSITDLVQLMHGDNDDVARAIQAALPAIASSVEAAVERLKRGGRLIYVGAGSAGRIGVLDASECKPTFNVSDGLVEAVIAGGQRAMWDAVEGAEDDIKAAQTDLGELSLGHNDVVVGVSASGATPYVLAAMELASNSGSLTIGISSNADSHLSRDVKHPIEVVTGPEFVAGSTRLKAGTAQKIVLNMISTVSMVKLGKTLGDLMVDVQATNGKLRNRALSIIRDITGASKSVASNALDAASGETKTAIAMILEDLDASSARRRLEETNGSLRAVADPSRPA